MPAPSMNASKENISRKDLLNWLNQCISKKCNKIEELCSGVAYCQIMEQYFPGSVSMKRVKLNAKLEYEFIHNLKVFQNSFKKIGVEKNVPIENLIKRKFQDNFEFLQWFKQFCESKSIETKMKNATDSKISIADTKKNQNIDTPAFFKSIPTRRSMQSTPISHLACDNKPSKVPSQQAEELKSYVNSVEADRNFYYNKLRQVEILIQKAEEKGELNDILQKIKDVVQCPDVNSNTNNL